MTAYLSTFFARFCSNTNPDTKASTNDDQLKSETNALISKHVYGIAVSADNHCVGHMQTGCRQISSIQIREFGSLYYIIFDSNALRRPIIRDLHLNAEHSVCTRYAGTRIVYMCEQIEFIY